MPLNSQTAHNIQDSQTKETLLQGSLKDGLYQFFGPSQSSSSSNKSAANAYLTSCRTPASLWHLRLGHPTFHTLNKYSEHILRNGALQLTVFPAMSMKMEQQERDSIRTASSEVSQQFQTLINANDLDTINQSQHLILGRLQDSNAVLSHFNEYSEQCFAEVSADFHKNTRLLKSMKSDLDYIFQKLRNMKAKICATYPDAFPDDTASKVLDQRPDLERPQ